jgi:hypothetical protein
MNQRHTPIINFVDGSVTHILKQKGWSLIDASRYVS